MNKEYEILNVVALLKDMPEKKLKKGQVGTIVEILGKNVYEIEFCNKNGETIASVSVKKEDTLLLHYDLVAA
ncbi:MAG: DUF4926 domain-containing protein [Bacteroidota bacterium]